MVGGTVDPGDVLPSGVRSYGSRKVGEKKNVAMSQRTQWQGQRKVQVSEGIRAERNGKVIQTT